MPQCAAGLNDFQLSAGESEGLWSLSSAVSNRKAQPETHGELRKGFDVAAVPSSVAVVPGAASGWLCLHRPVGCRPFWNSPWVSGGATRQPSSCAVEVLVSAAQPRIWKSCFNISASVS